MKDPVGKGQTPPSPPPAEPEWDWREAADDLLGNRSSSDRHIVVAVSVAALSFVLFLLVYRCCRCRRRAVQRRGLRRHDTWRARVGVADGTSGPGSGLKPPPVECKPASTGPTSVSAVARFVQMPEEASTALAEEASDTLSSDADQPAALSSGQRAFLEELSPGEAAYYRATGRPPPPSAARPTPATAAASPPRPPPLWPEPPPPRANSRTLDAWISSSGKGPSFAKSLVRQGAKKQAAAAASAVARKAAALREAAASKVSPARGGGRERLEEEPVVMLDVGTRKGPARLCIREGDHPQKLAAEFAAKHRLGADVRLKLEGVIRQQLALHADFQAAQATVSSSAAVDDDAARAARARKAVEAKARALGDDPPTPSRIGMAGIALIKAPTPWEEGAARDAAQGASWEGAAECTQCLAESSIATAAAAASSSTAAAAAITAGTTPSGPAGASESERDGELRFRRRSEVCRRPNGSTAGAANGGTVGAVNGGTAGGTAGGTDPTPGASSVAPSVQPPPLASHFALQINPGRQPRARAPIDVDEVSVAVIASLQAAGVNIAAELVAVDHLGAGSVKVTVFQGAAGRSTSQLVAGASEETFLAALAEELDASVELGTVPTTAITASPSRPLPSTHAAAATARASPPPFWAQPPRRPAPGM